MERTEIAILTILAIEVVTLLYAIVVIGVRNARRIKAHKKEEAIIRDIAHGVIARLEEEERKLDYILSNRRIKTRCGIEVEILTERDFPIHASFIDPDTGDERIISYTDDGHYTLEGEHKYDLIIPEVEPVKEEE